MNKEEIYNEMISLLEFIKVNGKLTDFSFDSRFQYSYLSALVNKTVRADTGKIRKGNEDTNKLIIKAANRFIKKNFQKST